MSNLDAENGALGNQGKQIILARDVTYRSGREGTLNLTRGSRGSIQMETDAHYVALIEGAVVPVKIRKAYANLVGPNSVIVPYDESVETLQEIKGEARSY